MRWSTPTSRVWKGCWPNAGSISPKQMNAVAMLRGIKRKAVERFDGSIILKPSVPSLQALERVKADLTGYLIDDLNYPAEISLETAASAGRWKDSGNLLEGFAIIIVGPNEVLAPFHNRCPLILEPKNYDHWLAPAESSHLPTAVLDLSCGLAGESFPALRGTPSQAGRAAAPCAQRGFESSRD